MTDDDLSTKLEALTDVRPEPADPAAQVLLRVKHKQRRRRGASALLTAAVATAAVLAVGPVLNAVHAARSEPGVAGSPAATPSAVLGGTPSASVSGGTPSTSVPGSTPSASVPGGVPSAGPSTGTQSGDHKTVMPAPWSAEAITKLPDANAYLPYKAYYIAKGTIPTERWAVVSFSAHGCLVGDEGAANSFGRPYKCFSDWRAGQRSAFALAQGYTKEKGGQKVASTLVMGAVSADARKVRLSVAGKRYTADAVATPSSNRLRFFAVVIPKKDLTVISVSVTPLDAAGNLADAVTGVPAGQP